MHGLDTGPMPPMTSYVGYSLEEPWGQPRVVFGVAAEEAERLAALLNGHDCVGPVHAEVTNRPDWRRTETGGEAAVHDAAVRDPAVRDAAVRDAAVRNAHPRDSLGIPAPRQQPASDLLPPGRQPDSSQSAGPQLPGAAAQHEPPHSLDSRPQRSGMLPAVPMLAVPTHDRAGTRQPETKRPRNGTGGGEPASARPRKARPADEAQAADGASVAAGTSAASPPAEPPQYEEPYAYQDPYGAQLVVGVEDARPGQVSGNRGRRYQGFPPRYQPGPDPKRRTIRLGRLREHDDTAEAGQAAKLGAAAERESLAELQAGAELQRAGEPDNGAEHGNAAQYANGATPEDAAEHAAAELSNAAEPRSTAELANAAELTAESEDGAPVIEEAATAGRRKRSKRSRQRRAGTHDAGGWPQAGQALTDGAPADVAPADAAPADAAPADGAPADAAPAAATRADAAPADGAPADAAPADGPPAAATPADAAI